MSEPTPSMRVDLWLWHARFFKTRSLASKIVKAKKVRINGTLISKASSPVCTGDVLTFTKEGAVKVIEIVKLSDRRGPYSEAITLYSDLSPLPAPKSEYTGDNENPSRARGMGRPTKKDRRAYNKFTET